MNNWVLASGGNEFHSEYQEADLAALNKRKDKNQPLLIVVTAPHPTQELAYKLAKKYFNNMGIDTEMSNILSKDDLNDKNINQLLNYSGIYFAGGTPSRLTNCFIDTKAESALQKAIENEVVFMGSSAGAMFFGKEVVMPNGESLGRGLNILENCIALAHFSGTWPQWSTGYQDRGFKLIGLGEGGSLLTNPQLNENSQEFGSVEVKI